MFSKIKNVAKRIGQMSLEETIQEKKQSLNNAHFMLVDGMSKLLTGKVKSCVSSDFIVGGLKWTMILYPEEEHLVVGLMITDPKCIGSIWKVECTFRLTLVHPLLPNISQLVLGCFDDNDRKFGDQKFVPLIVLKEAYVINDNALFYVEIIGEVKPKFIDVTSIIPRTIGTAERIKLVEVAKNKSRFTWKITQFSSFNGEHHSSHVFTVGPRKWCIQMYPKGNLEGKGNSLSLFLHATDYVPNAPKTRTLAVYKLRVWDQLKRNHHEMEGDAWFHYGSNAIGTYSGFRKFLPLEELRKPSRGFLVNDEIYVGVEFLIISTTEYL